MPGLDCTARIPHCAKNALGRLNLYGEAEHDLYGEAKHDRAVPLIC